MPRNTTAMTVTPCVVSVEETMFVTQYLVNVLVDVNNIGWVSDVTVRNLCYNKIRKKTYNTVEIYQS